MLKPTAALRKEAPILHRWLVSDRNWRLTFRRYFKFVALEDGQSRPTADQLESRKSKRDDALSAALKEYGDREHLDYSCGLVEAW